MFSFFNPPFPIHRTPVVVPMYSYITDRMNNELTKVEEFYRTNIYTVKNTHVLAKLLVELTNYIHLDPENLVRHIRAITPALERAYRFNSSIVDGGVITDGNLYNRNVPEVWLSVAYEFSVDECYKHYQKLNPIRAVTHPFTDVNMNIPNGTYSSSQQGYCVVTVDLALLALQYKAWRDKEQYLREQDMYLPLHYFIQQYPLTGYIATHVDVAIFNRLSYLLFQKPIPPSRSAHSYMVFDHGQRIDETHLKLLDVLKRRHGDYIEILKSIPSLKYGNFYMSNTFPDIAPTRQIKWVLVLAKISIIEFLLEIDRVSGNSGMNLYERDQIARELRVVRNDKSLFGYLDRDTIERIDKIYDQVNRE